MSLRPTKGELCGSVGKTLDYGQLDIFSVPPASRLGDPITSKLAGKRAEDRCSEGKLSKLHSQVLDAFRVNGPMNDEVLENLPIFRGKYAPSTIRKRRSELSLCVPPRLVAYGLMTNSNGSPMTIWTLAPAKAQEAA